MNRQKVYDPREEIIMERMINVEISKDGVTIKIVNLTPHEISFVFENGSVFKIAPSGVVVIQTVMPLIFNRFALANLTSVFRLKRLCMGGRSKDFPLQPKV